MKTADMSKRISVKVPLDELKEWKSLFNDTDKWGIKTQFERENKKNVSRNTLNWVLAKGSGYQATIDEIRKFVKKQKSIQDA